MEEECLVTLVGEDTICFRPNLSDIEPSCLEPADVIFNAERVNVKITQDNQRLKLS